MRSVEEILLDQHQRRMALLTPAELVGEKGRTVAVSPARVVEMRQLQGKGIGFRQIAREVGVSISTVSRLLGREKPAGASTHQPQDET